MVGLEENDTITSVLLDGSQPSPLLKEIRLPNNPRIANHELYEIDGMDMIMMVSCKTLKRDTVRWLRRLKYMQIPMLVLIYQPEKKPAREQKYQKFAQETGVPIVLFESDNLQESRQKLLDATMEVAPSMAVALAANIDPFRPLLVDAILQDSIKLSLIDNAPLHEIQSSLTHQISVAYGAGGYELKQAQSGLQAMMSTINNYTQSFVNRFFIRSAERRARFEQAVSTMLIGYATTVYHRETPPSLRKVILPAIWRLYRESRHAV